MELETRLAEFFQCESAVLYSYGFSTVASAIPAYAKSGDVIFADQAVSFPIQRGLQASRSRIVYFRHNDIEHLRSLLEQQALADRKNPKKANATRRFLMVEGIYMNTGDICKLPELVALRKEYRLRLFIDESCSFGTLGKHGRGVTDHFNIPLEEVDLILSSLEMVGASTGGFAAGTRFVVEHQRLNGIGYVFSASLPPMLAAAAKEMLNVLSSEGSALVPNLHDRCEQLHKNLRKALPQQVRIVGDAISPIKHLTVCDVEGLSVEEQEAALYKVVKEAEHRGVAIVVASINRSLEAQPQPPSIRLAVNVRLTDQEIADGVTAIAGAFQTVLKGLQG